MFKKLFTRKDEFASYIHMHDHALRRALGPWNLIAMGLGSTIGSGIFVVTGQAAALYAGPAVLISLVLAAICCGFTALCYAEFAAILPISGSSYTYAHATLGEVTAWFIGWNMVLEYGISGSAVIVGWSGYFTGFISHFGWHIPFMLTRSPVAFTNSGGLVLTGALFNLPALIITLILTWLCYIGIKESTRFNMLMVIIKIAIILIVVIVGYHYIDTNNWHPFIPSPKTTGQYGWHGVWLGAGMVFFAYSGFEAISTVAQECRKPQRDLPLSMLLTLIICVILYIAVTAVMTGLVPYEQLDSIDPMIAAVKQHPELHWLIPVVETGILIALTSVALTVLIAQPRIFMSMADDGLLPKVMNRIHPRYHTPHINTLITGVSMAVVAAVFPLNLLINLCCMGSLLNFMAVCAGVLILRYKLPELKRPFRVPWAWGVCSAGILSCLGLMTTFSWLDWRLLTGWAVLGLLFYFGYGYRHSHLQRQRGTMV